MRAFKKQGIWVRVNRHLQILLAVSSINHTSIFKQIVTSTLGAFSSSSHRFVLFVARLIVSISHFKVRRLVQHGATVQDPMRRPA